MATRGIYENEIVEELNSVEEEFFSVLARNDSDSESDDGENDNIDLDNVEDGDISDNDDILHHNENANFANANDNAYQCSCGCYRCLDMDEVDLGRFLYKGKLVVE